MTTITRLKQLRDQLAGKLLPQRVERKPNPSRQDVSHNPLDWIITLDRFRSYREKIMPRLQDTGYGYFLACDSKEYQTHQEWCNKYGEEDSLAHCDVWQLDCFYPRAFAGKADAALFILHFDARTIDDD